MNELMFEQAQNYEEMEEQIQMYELLKTLKKAQSRRRFPDWTPTPTKGKFKASAFNTDVIYRMLEFVDLEITVGNWVITSGSDNKLQDEITKLLNRNAADETKHEEVLKLLRNYVDAPSTISSEASALIQRWEEQEPSFALAYALEMGVFMTILPWLNKNGDVYCSTVSGWISDDETVHVITNAALAKHTGSKLTKEHFALVIDTLAYIFRGESDVTNRIKRACQRLRTGKDNGMMDESVVTTIAFFEQYDKQPTEYAA
jgi:hypothetical protein